jgi:hypothetical protein
MEKLDRIYELRMLLAREGELQIPLNDVETVRLARLERALGRRVPSVDERDSETWLPVPMPIQFTAQGAYGSGIVRNLSGGGMAVITSEPPALGQRMVVRVEDQAHGVEYVFPARVISRVVKGLAAMGVAFEGVPSQTRLGNRNSGVWRNELPETNSDKKPAIR